MRRLLSYGFHITFVLALFHDKECCNCINLFPCILWVLIVMGLDLSGEDLLKKLISRLVSRVTHDLFRESLTTWPNFCNSSLGL